MSAIEWTGRTWNPWVGCNRISAGCSKCYAERMARRLTAMGREHYAGTVGERGWTGRVNIAPDHLWRQPLAWPACRIFPCSMSDFYHQGADAWRPAALEIIAARPDHDWQILTKRPERIGALPDHVWMGVTVENERALERIAHLRERAPDVAVRWLSIEPILEALPGLAAALDAPGAPIDWIVLGAESGPGCRPCPLDWLREVRDVASERGIPLMLKQLGGYPDKRAEDKALLDGRRWIDYPRP